MGTPKLTLKPKQHNSKILHCLAKLHFLNVTICRYRVHTVKRYVFLLSSPPTQIHRNTFLELAFKSPSSHLYLLQQTMLPVHPATREGTLSCCSWPSWTLSSCGTGEWLNRPPTSKWLELSNRKERGVSGGQAAAKQVSNRTLLQPWMLLGDERDPEVLLMLLV